MTDKSSPAKTGLMICGHGSRDGNAVSEFNNLARHLAKRFPEYEVESGFLEFATPVLRTGLDKLKDKGCERILCLPGMLFAAGHVKNDLPSEVNEFANDNPDIEVHYGRELAIDARLLQAASARIEQAEAAAKSDISRKDTMLMVVGRGTNDSDANSNVCKVARMLWEGLKVGWTEVSYSGVTTPLVDAGLAHAVRLGYKRIIVFPYFLFTGILVQRIYDWTDEAAAAHPDIEFIKAPYLNDQPLLIDTFASRVEEMLSGDNVMNCRLCKYREQIIGFEADVGAPQVGHHHHVRGIGTDNDHDHGHHHHHDHDHG
ncbi:MAG: sirohydrochlorin chelatase [Rhodospirillaceae bacterium]|jgi:sirohydrochlorin cobaltochelatase|nr:sirohydrochlorin chelatase [Alphaproteobacteria bacterium]MBT4463144.1 sirohydrochlorin chelatase [Rhodospirillaceae bacterium]MBT5308291.1 sirohydrochlorin chelatase [Rhodospirillaceae bacterium]MBT6406331.1 sirohydrochlorin chelatase [Rhodospirillaceae bacterium]MBT7356326.1 sirohydrochlorin chelatase [Rhodospirillaceae bacterium]